MIPQYEIDSTFPNFDDSCSEKRFRFMGASLDGSAILYTETISGDVFYWRANMGVVRLEPCPHRGYSSSDFRKDSNFSLSPNGEWAVVTLKRIGGDPHITDLHRFWFGQLERSGSKFPRFMRSEILRLDGAFITNDGTIVLSGARPMAPFYGIDVTPCQQLPNGEIIGWSYSRLDNRTKLMKINEKETQIEVLMELPGRVPFHTDLEETGNGVMSGIVESYCATREQILVEFYRRSPRVHGEGRETDSRGLLREKARDGHPDQPLNTHLKRGRLLLRNGFDGVAYVTELPDDLEYEVNLPPIGNVRSVREKLSAQIVNKGDRKVEIRQVRSAAADGRTIYCDASVDRSSTVLRLVACQDTP